MEEEPDIELELETEDDEWQTFWVPANNDEALRWECLKLAASLIPSDGCLKLASSMYRFVHDNKTGPIGVAK